MSDGAHLGVGAEQALHAVMGGEQPTVFETAAEMHDRIMATTLDEGRASYDGAATYTAKLILLAAQARPELLANTDDFDLYTVLKAGVDDDDREVLSSLTGFQWGWAENAARRCVELPPVPNPAIITIGEP